MTGNMADTQDFQASTASHTGGFEDEESLSPLEQEVLDEYARLLGNLNDVCQPPSSPIPPPLPPPPPLHAIVWTFHGDQLSLQEC